MVVTRHIMILVVVSVLVMVEGENRCHTCHCPAYSHNCSSCDIGRCCSPSGWCGSTDAYCTRPTPAPYSSSSAADEPDQDGHYNHDTISKNTTANPLVLATYDPNAIPHADDENMLVVYGSAKCCGQIAETDINVGRKCLKVTNEANGEDAMVKMIEKKCSRCSSDLELDYNVFQHLDQSGNGIARGYLYVSYHYVMCN